jgi:hypothetical protein
LPEPGPGSIGDEFMTPPASGARSQWSSDVTGKRAAGDKAKKMTKATKSGKKHK